MEDALNTHRKVTPDREPSDVSHPLRGVVLCCTSITPEKRSKLASQAEQMGAVHKFDLTSEITHLIVGDYDTPKYRYVAKERPDVRVLTPQWIEAVRELWIEDQAIDIRATEREHSLPTFASLRICLTGFEDPQRQQIIDQVYDNGGEYHGDLTKTVTHLIVNKAEGAKYKHAKAWALRLVSVEWLHDSVGRGMILDETLYNPEWPVEERGKGAWNRRATSLGKRPREDNSQLLDNCKRKLRRTASTKLSSQSEKIWGDIVGSKNEIQAANSGEWGESAVAQVIEERPADRANSATAPTESSSDSNSLSCRTAPSLSGGIFSGCQLYSHGFDRKKTQLLESHLRSHEAYISASLDTLITAKCPQSYLILSHSTQSAEVPKLPQWATHIQVVTEWWVERCIGTKSLVNPVDYALGCPFPKFPLQRFDGLVICPTGFESLQLLHVSRVVALMGAKFEETLSKDVSVLICNSLQNIRKEKLVLAHELKIPAVSLEWLLESIRAGERQLFAPYLQHVKKVKTGSTLPTVTSGPVQNEKYTDDGDGSDMKHRSSAEKSRPGNVSKLDQTAFQDDVDIKVEIEELPAPLDSSIPVGPLAELSPNSTRKSQTPSKRRKSIDRTVPSPTSQNQAINNAMTSLLAKSRTVAGHSNPQTEQTDRLEGRRKQRAPNRILGRAASNVSAASASSVDSTASTGQAVVWPSHKSGSGDQRSSSSLRPNIEKDEALAAFAEDLESTEAEKEDNQPPPTQMQYEDPESMEYQATLLARIKGEKIVRKEKERVATISSLSAGEPPRMRKGRVLRDRQSGGLR